MLDQMIAILAQLDSPETKLEWTLAVVHAATASPEACFALQCRDIVIAFSFPVVPKGKGRIRVQLSAAHSREDLEFARNSRLCVPGSCVWTISRSKNG